MTYFQESALDKSIKIKIMNIEKILFLCDDSNKFKLNDLNHVI